MSSNVANEQDITPTEPPQPVSGVATLEALGIALCTVGSGFVAGAEVHRGRSHVEQEVFLRAAAERCRNLRHFLSESEQLLIAIAGYSSDRTTAVVAVKPEGRNLVTKLRIVCLAVGAGLLAGAATVGLATAYPKVALGLTALGGTLMALGTNLPAPKT